MWRSVVWSCLLLVACAKKKDAAPTDEPVRPVRAVPAVRIDAASADAVVDARPLAEGEYATRADRYLVAYLDLLWVDLALHEMLQAYPGAPTTNRYTTYRYDWSLPARQPLEAALRRAKLAAERVRDDDADRAVLAYTTLVLEAWPSLDGLATYYKEQRYVDDEFARGRREQALVGETLAKIEPLRKPMTESVFAGWRTVAGGNPESPRAVLGASFEACMRLAMLLFERPRVQTKPDPKVEEAIDEAMGACRRGVGAVSALPEAFRSFDKPLRTVALSLGNAVDSNSSRQYAIADVEQLVKAYVERWPKLPSEPAERPGER